MAGKRKDLFIARRDVRKSGNLELYFPDSNIAASPSKEFWKAVVYELEVTFGSADYREVRDIIQECLDNWE